MKVGIVAIVFAVAGVAFGVGYNAYLFGWVRGPHETLFTNLPEPQEVEPILNETAPRKGGTRKTTKPNPKLPPLPPADGPQPRAVASEPKYDFGTMMSGDKGQHEFVLTNEGQFPLELAKGKTSCKCTISDLPVTTLAPGESTKVLVTWKTNVSRSGKFRQTARILTNDPKHRTLTFTISGELTVLLRSVPTYLSFGRLTPTESKTIEFKLHSYHLIVAQLEVESFDFENPETAKFFDVVFEPMSKDKLDKGATSGLIGKVTLKPGKEGEPSFPVGGIRQTLRLKTNVREVNSLPVTIGGAIVEEFAYSGRGWNNGQKLLDLGELSDDKPTTRTLNVWIRGPHWDKVEVDIERVEPAGIQVFKKSTQKRDSTKVQHVVLEITIEKGTKIEDLVGPEPEKLGHIILKTTHPDIKQLDIPIRIGAADKQESSPMPK